MQRATYRPDAGCSASSKMIMKRKAKVTVFLKMANDYMPFVAVVSLLLVLYF